MDHAAPSPGPADETRSICSLRPFAVFEWLGVRRSPVWSKILPASGDADALAPFRFRFVNVRSFAASDLKLLLDAVPDLRGDQRRMLPGIDFRMMPDAAGIDRVGQDVVDVTIAEPGATFHPARDQCSDGRLQAKRINGFFDDARVPVFEVEVIDRADHLAHRVRRSSATGHRRHSPAARSRPSRGLSSSRLRSCRGCVRRSPHARTGRRISSMFSVSRPMLVAVLNDCVTETKDVPAASSRSTILAKSASERVSLSIL